MRTLRLLVAAVLTILTLSACTPEQVAQYLAVTEPTRSALTTDQLARLRDCESGGDYTVVSSSGAYRGAYQFHQDTWDSVADRHYPWLVGVDPAAAAFYWQDAMARALWAEAGPSPWPVCGRRV